MKVKLFTRDGGFVRDGETPPFNPPPEILFWGSRVFVHDESFTPDDDGVIGYVEGLTYSLDAADALLSRTNGNHA